MITISQLQQVRWDRSRRLISPRTGRPFLSSSGLVPLVEILYDNPTYTYEMVKRRFSLSETTLNSLLNLLKAEGVIPNWELLA